MHHQRTRIEVLNEIARLRRTGRLCDDLQLKTLRVTGLPFFYFVNKWETRHCCGLHNWKTQEN